MTLADAASNAVAHWDLDETSGTRSDSVGSNDLTDNNTVGNATGKFGNCADFESTNSEYLDRADTADLSMGDIDFMVRCWVKPENVSGTKGICYKGDGSNLEFDLRLVGGIFSFRVSSGSGFANLTTVSTADVATAGNWYLVHAWHDSVNNEIGITYNDATPSTTSYSSGSYDSGGNFWMGDNGFTQPYDGLIDDFLILKNYILDADEIEEDYDSGTGVAFADWNAGAAVAPTGQLYGPLFGPLGGVA